MAIPPQLSAEQKDTALNQDPQAAAPAYNDMSDVDMKKSSSSSRELESLRVSDDELVGNLTYSQLSLYEKKSCVAGFPSRDRGFPTYLDLLIAGSWYALN